MNNQIINDWRPETAALLKRLIEAGITIVSVDNGEDETKFTDVVFDRFVLECIACDEARLYIKLPGRDKTNWLYLVYGNSPGELVSDYSYPADNKTASDLLDKVTKEHGDTWELQGQPKCHEDDLYKFYRGTKLPGE
jgi:hypothetical protein